MKDYNKKIHEMTPQNFYAYAVQLVVLVLLVLALAFHIAEVGLIGIGLIIIVTAFTGLTKEHDLGVAFTNAMPFAALIVVFFAILAVVHEQHIVQPLVDWVFTFDEHSRLLVLFFTNGTLSFVSDNVFVATVFINEVQNHCVVPNICDHCNTVIAGGETLLKEGITKEEHEHLAVVVNMGTNIPAMATPNGHAALLFLLTSSLAPLLRLSYLRMILLTLPYTIVLTFTGAVAIYYIATLTKILSDILDILSL